ncbi:MAG: sigma-70 family RNA polymerase sigma factor [Singulisphaera sp.]
MATESMATSDAETLLIQQVRSGDAPTWRLLIERYEGRLLAFVDSRLRDRAASEDVVQETFVGFLTSLPHYDEKRDLEAYLFSIAAHKMTDHLRKQGRRPIDQFGSDDHGRPLEEVPGGGRPASSIARSGERRKAEERLLTEALGGLVREWLGRGEFDRLRCLELLIVKGWANKDVAAYLSLTEQAVASYKFQTVARLKEMARRAGLSLDGLGSG